LSDQLAPALLEALAQFARLKVLVAFDYDGTLAPIVAHPEDAALRESTRTRFRTLCQLYPCIVVSGRERRDVLSRLDGAEVVEVIGNHGLEPWHQAEHFAGLVREWLPVLREELIPFKGLTVENKTLSISVHYRHCPDPPTARQAIVAVAGRLGPLRIVGGKYVVNLLPADAPHKGVALRAARERFHCEAAIYVGDDETDEDVFAFDHPAPLLAIRVGPRESSRATFFLHDQETIDVLIETLLCLRPSTDPDAPG